MEGGRILNAPNRQIVSERTKERVEGAASYANDAATNARNRANNLDCSVLPRPPVCDFGIDPKDTDGGG
jgi:hypothetical protein